MRFTKKILNEYHIFNPYDLSDMIGGKIFVEYIHADNGRLTSHYAYWRMVRNEGGKRYHKEFTVTHREAKQPILQEAIAYVHDTHHIDLTDKDAFGAYHPEGTLRKLKNMFKS